MRDILPITGKVKIEIFRDGSIVKTILGKNIVTNNGMESYAGILRGEAITLPGWIGLGSGSSPPLATNTALETPIAGTRTAFSSTSRVGKEISYLCTFTAANGMTVKEAGIFNHATAGIMFARFLVETITLQTGETLDFTWTLNIGGD